MAGSASERRAADSANPATSHELEQLRRLYAREQARGGELERALRRFEANAEDDRRMFAELRRQLGHMNELHRISTLIGSILDPSEVMQRTLEGVGRLVENDAAGIYLLEGHVAHRVCSRGREDLLPPATVSFDDDQLGAVLAGRSPSAVSPDGVCLTVAMRASATTIGALHLLRERSTPLTDDDRKLADLIAAVAAAAIQNARLYEQTQRLATTDPLTGLSNVRCFREALAMEVARASRLDYSVGLLMIDVDDFKRVNDTFGHPAGDDVLRNVGRVLQTNLRQTDVAARYGGEEFAVILPGLDARGVRAVGEKLRRAVRGLVLLPADGGQPLRITISVGGVAWSPPRLDAADLVRVADMALYEAKRRGKDCVCVLSGNSRGHISEKEAHRYGSDSERKS
ncbi:MAG: GGDEF domain-containing protein [Chloroflexota bacterium]|nr:GGDEF domain-containing protein [Chloroflexota bacterium]